MPLERGRKHALDEDAVRIVLAVFHLVAHHGHLAVEILAGDERVDHAIGFHGERPVEVLRRRGEGLVIIRAIEPGRAIEIHAAPPELGHDVAARRGALEHQMLEQMRHAGLAVIFVRRADPIGDVDRRRGLGCIRKEQHRQPAVDHRRR